MKIAPVDQIHLGIPHKSKDSVNPFSQSMGSTDKCPTHMDLNASGKSSAQPTGSDGDGLLDVHRRKRTRKHKNKNRTECHEGDSSVSESPKMKSTKLVSVSVVRKVNGTNKPTVNKHVR